MRGTLTVLQIAAENFPPGDVARSQSGELSKDGQRPSISLHNIHVATGCIAGCATRSAALPLLSRSCNVKNGFCKKLCVIAASSLRVDVTTY